MSQEITYAHCNTCGRSTNHDVVAADKREVEAKADDDNWYDLYEMLKCRGCESVTLRHTQQWWGDTTIVYYPPEIARRAPHWLCGIPDLVPDPDAEVPAPICALMREVYTAVQNGSRRLVAMGIRAALESVMIEKVGDQNHFKDNADAFQKAGYLSERQRGTLDTILGAGHAAIHRGWEPTISDIDTLLDITESIIEEAYLHEGRAKGLDKNVPKRRPRMDRQS